MRWFWQVCDKIHHSEEAEQTIKDLERSLDYTRRLYEEASRYREDYWKATEEIIEKDKDIVDLREHVSTLRDLLWSAELELRELKGLDVRSIEKELNE